MTSPMKEARRRVQVHVAPDGRPRVLRRAAPGDGQVRRALLASGVLALTLGLADSALADYSAKVDKDTLNIVGDGASDKLALFVWRPPTCEVDVADDGTIGLHLRPRDASRPSSVKAQGGDDQVRIDQQRRHLHRRGDHRSTAAPATTR